MNMERTTSLDLTDADILPGDPTGSEGGPAEDAASPPAIAWLAADEADLVGLDFEAPIAGSTSPTCDALSDLYRRAAYPQKPGEQLVETPGTRVFAMLSAVTSMYLKAQEREEPFGPLMLSGDRRTAIPADFRGEPVKLLSDMALRSVNPVLKARLADMCWLLERRRGTLAAAAVGSYVDTD